MLKAYLLFSSDGAGVFATWKTLKWYSFFNWNARVHWYPVFLLVVFNRRVPLGSVFNFRHLSLPPSREFDESLHTSALYIISPGCKSSCGYFRHSSKLPSKRSTATKVKWSTWHRTPSMHTLLFRHFRVCANCATNAHIFLINFLIE
jgi:hypothetical protein